MNYVEPLRDLEDVKNMHDYLYSKNPRNALLFSFGIYTGLRISDILKFKVKDVKDNSYSIRETKTGKQMIMQFNPHLKKEIEKYIQDKDDNEYLFKSREGYNKPITRNRVYDILQDAAKVCKIKSKIGTHTMRKTFGYHIYNERKDVAELMDLYNHTSQSITLRYIGVNTDNKNKIIKSLNFYK